MRFPILFNASTLPSAASEMEYYPYLREIARNPGCYWRSIQYLLFAEYLGLLGLLVLIQKLEFDTMPRWLNLVIDVHSV